MSILTNSISPNQRKPFNLQSELAFNTPTPIDRTKSHHHDQNNHPRSVHFENQPILSSSLSPSQIPPRRLFNSDRSQQQKDINNSHISHPTSEQKSHSFSVENNKYPSLPSQSESFFNLNQLPTHSSPPHQTSSVFVTPKKSTPDWLQELVDQAKPNLDSSTISSNHKLFGHFPSTSHSTLSKSQAFSPLQSSLPQISNQKASKSIDQSSVSQSTPTPRINSKVPISLNPNLTAGVKLGQLQLSQRLRVNLISFVFLLIFTSTKTFDKLLDTIDSRFPSLSTPVFVLEWLILLLLFGNTLEAYYKLKTRAPITHVEIPLTPQQIRGNISTPQSLRNSSPNVTSRASMDPKSSIIALQRSNIKSPTKRTLLPEPSSYKKAWSTSILTHDPLANPLSQSTGRIFKRHSLDPNSNNLSSSLNASQTIHSSSHSPNVRRPHELQLSQSVRKVSNPNTLHCLLEETLR
ncbi:uncharacterized protein MELLADRAFT_95925 [Melampsora larici-populina 98AG31]|uniref:Uncharacterized protein n=1 Tax=Melampsora larici-populina (strain 98AG31 / pathotype 3-4-7) TaxID=747676 RepID=F4RDR8_MELLP|nr:uncharacterized protein MELLADRAFT_95925 [Melampsora larici-populina 98AG31]EGG09560.1 hypothetical protein MELLADRAFT_95925 [Melampsora larici-populina 98AG31]